MSNYFIYTVNKYRHKNKKILKIKKEYICEISGLRQICQKELTKRIVKYYKATINNSYDMELNSNYLKQHTKM